MGAAIIEQTAAFLASTSTLASPAVGRTTPAAAVAIRPCLVVCPSTLVAHWAHEVGRYISKDVLRPLQYQGTPGERLRLQVREEEPLGLQGDAAMRRPF
jgi:SNF2 family DNA or RNA helicase